MRLFDKVAIIGTGLIGGSLALAIKKKHLAGETVGVSRSVRTIALAQKSGAIDRGSIDLTVIKGSDLVILATPVSTMIKLAPDISDIVTDNCIITDVGSTKKEVVGVLDRLFPHYIGTHPLAGSEKRGIRNANTELFKGSLCIFTPTARTDPKALKKMQLFWKSLGTKSVFLSADAHDRIVSFVSHLPHIAAFSTISIVPGRYLKFAASGLKDTTRIASSDSELWADIFLSNRKNVLRTIKLLKTNLAFIQSALEKKDRQALGRILRTAKRKRESLN